MTIQSLEQTSLSDLKKLIAYKTDGTSDFNSNSLLYASELLVDITLDDKQKQPLQTSYLVWRKQALLHNVHLL